MNKSTHPAVSAILAIAERMPETVGDNPVRRQLLGEVNRLRDGARALDNVNANRNPLDTPAAHALKVAKMARAFGKETTASINRSVQAWAAGKEDLKRRIEEKINLKADPTFAVAIATRFSGLSGKAQTKLLSELVDENRGPELAAIIKAPPSLTGLNVRQIAMYEQAIASRHAAAELDEIEKLDEAYGAFDTVQRAAGSLEKQLTNPDKLAKIESGANAADEATDAFNQSLSSEAA